MRESWEESRGCPAFTPTPGLSLFFDTPPPHPSGRWTNKSGDSESALSSWHLMGLTVLFILSSARSKVYERAVGNGGTGLERLKQNAKFSLPQFISYTKCFLKVICVGYIFRYYSGYKVERKNILWSRALRLRMKNCHCLIKKEGGTWKLTVNIFLVQIKCGSYCLFCFRNKVYLSLNASPQPQHPLAWAVYWPVVWTWVSILRWSQVN